MAAHKRRQKNAVGTALITNMNYGCLRHNVMPSIICFVLGMYDISDVHEPIRINTEFQCSWKLPQSSEKLLHESYSLLRENVISELLSHCYRIKKCEI